MPLFFHVLLKCQKSNKDVNDSKVLSEGTKVLCANECYRECKNIESVKIIRNSSDFLEHVHFAKEIAVWMYIL